MILNDATGRIFVRLINGPGHRLDGVVRGQYVMLAGLPYLYWCTGAWDFEAFSSRRAIADEVSYHTIETVHALLSLQHHRDMVDIEDTSATVVPPETVERRHRGEPSSSSQGP